MPGGITAAVVWHTSKILPLEKRTQKLIRDSSRGDDDARRALYLHYRKPWYMTCLRYADCKADADDFLQEGLIAIFRDLHQFDARKGSFGAWSNRVLINAILQYLRKWKRVRFHEYDPAQADRSTTGPAGFEGLGARELIRLIRNLPVGYRTVFNLFAIEGYRHKEIAEMLGISESTSKTQLHKARQLLQQQLEHILQS